MAFQNTKVGAGREEAAPAHSRARTHARTHSSLFGGPLSVCWCIRPKPFGSFSEGKFLVVTLQQGALQLLLLLK